MKHVVSIGGGLSSTLALPLYVSGLYPNQTELLMAVLPNEHPDVWRLCDAAERLTGTAVTYIAEDGRGKWRYVDRAEIEDPTSGLLTPFDVFFRDAFLGNSRVDPCSRALKRDTIRQYMLDTKDPAKTTLYVGITADEWDRYPAIKSRWSADGFETKAPLSNMPEIDRDYLEDMALKLVGFVPYLYTLGFRHNNCGGACIKAGHREWARLLYYQPDVYAEWELAENIWRARHGDYSILRDRSGGNTTPLPLTTFRLRMEREFAGVLPTMVDLLIFNRLETSPPCMACMAA